MSGPSLRSRAETLAAQAAKATPVSTSEKKAAAKRVKKRASKAVQEQIAQAKKRS